MTKSKLENLNCDPSDAVLTPLGTPSGQLTMAEIPRPRSPEGQEIFSAAAETLLGTEDGYGLSQFLIEAHATVFNGYYDQLDSHINELRHGIVDDIEDAVLRQFLRSLNFSAADLEWVAQRKLNKTLASQASVGLSSVLDADVFSSLMCTLRDRLPHLVGEALRWHIDTSELTKFLSAEIERFMVQELLPQAARNICNAEVVMSGPAQSANGDTLSGGHSHG